MGRDQSKIFICHLYSIDITTASRPKDTVDQCGLTANKCPLCQILSFINYPNYSLTDGNSLFYLNRRKLQQSARLVVPLHTTTTKSFIAVLVRLKLSDIYSFKRHSLPTFLHANVHKQNHFFYSELNFSPFPFFLRRNHKSRTKPSKGLMGICVRSVCVYVCFCV